MRKPLSLCSEIIGSANRIAVENDAIFSLLRNQPDMAWLIAPNAAGLWYNDVFYDYTRKTEAYMRNWAWQDFLPLEEIPRVAGSLYHSLATAEAWEAVYHIRDYNGDYRQYLSKAAPLHDKRGAIKYWIGNAVDITDRVDARLKKTHRK